MKYRIFAYTLSKNIKKEIYTYDLEAERKRIEKENPGFKVDLKYETISKKE